ncbi:fec operon regulator FecR [compost metagenome]
MFEKEFDIATLINLQQKGQLTSAQQEMLDAWVAANQKNHLLLEELGNEERVQKKLSDFNRISEDRAWSQVLTGIHPTTIEIRNRYIWPNFWIAAAAVLAVVFGIWFYTLDSPHNTSQHDWVKNDIAPGKNGASLTLSTGQTIQLNDAKNGVVIDPKSLIYEDGTPVFFTDKNGRHPAGAEMTASTAMGQTYSFTLSDGTKVWLNAGSSLSFPYTFTGKHRMVKLVGEGYFEVAKDKKHPFLVQSNGQLLEVLGTHFNINSYADEKRIKTTLLEGSIKVSIRNTAEGLVLAPGEQSVLGSRGLTKAKVDLEAEMSWKKGYFRFDDEPIESVMRKLSRWYNIEVIYEKGAANQSLNGMISRNNPISTVLVALETTKAIHFKVEGRRVTVMR